MARFSTLIAMKQRCPAPLIQELGSFFLLLS
jgi:hypothetical protein